MKFRRRSVLLCTCLNWIAVANAVLFISSCDLKRPRQCPRGFGVAKSCTNRNDTICAPCSRNRTFSARASNRDACIACSTCGDNRANVRQSCTPQRDAICWCETGEIRDVATGECVRGGVDVTPRQPTEMPLELMLSVTATKSSSSSDDYNYFAHEPSLQGPPYDSRFGNDVLDNDGGLSGGIAVWEIVLLVLVPVLSGLVVVKVWLIRRERARRAPVWSSRRRENESRSPLLVEGKDDEEEAIEMPIRKGNVGRPCFNRHLKSQYCHEGIETRLHCLVTGSPEPDVWWEFNGRRIDASNRDFDVDETSLVIANLSPRLAGRYSCQATNEYGQATTQATLSVIGKFDQSDELPPSDCLINSRLPVTTPETVDIAEASSTAGALYNPDLGEAFRRQFPGTHVRIGPYAAKNDDEDDESSINPEDTLYAQRMAYHVGCYRGSYLQEMQTQRREDVNLRAQQMGFTSKNIRFLAGGKLSSDEESDD